MRPQVLKASPREGFTQGNAGAPGTSVSTNSLIQRNQHMAKSRSLQQAVRFALATATAAAGVAGLHAQQARAPAAAPVEEVVVTGSRLSTPNEQSISPITSVSATDLQATGLTRVEDVLNNLPMVFAGQNSTVRSEEHTSELQSLA